MWWPFYVIIIVSRVLSHIHISICKLISSNVATVWYSLECRVVTIYVVDGFWGLPRQIYARLCIIKYGHCMILIRVLCGGHVTLWTALAGFLRLPREIYARLCIIKYGHCMILIECCVVAMLRCGLR